MHADAQTTPTGINRANADASTNASGRFNAVLMPSNNGDTAAVYSAYSPMWQQPNESQRPSWIIESIIGARRDAPVATLADFVLRAELTPGATVMVEKAPDEDDREVSLTVVEPGCRVYRLYQLIM